MHNKHNLRNLLVAALLLTLGLGYASVLMAGGHHGCHCCPECDNPVCQPTPVTVKVSKHCWEVECKQICIPAFKGPWAPCCEEPKCGRVRTVKILKKVPYECEKCGYKWEVKCLDCCEK